MEGTLAELRGLGLQFGVLLRCLSSPQVRLRGMAYQTYVTASSLVRFCGLDPRGSPILVDGSPLPTLDSRDRAAYGTLCDTGAVFQVADASRRCVCGFETVPGSSHVCPGLPLGHPRRKGI